MFNEIKNNSNSNYLHKDYPEQSIDILLYVTNLVTKSEARR